MLTKIKLLNVALFLVLTTAALAQTTVSGVVLDAESGDPLFGANVTIKGKVVGTITDFDGKFELKTNVQPPFTLVVSYTGYSAQEQEVTSSGANLEFKLSASAIIGGEVVVSASRVEESILTSPVTVEKMDILAIRQSSSHDYFDDLLKLKGVQANQGSMTFTSINTRGFTGVANVRFVQLMDGMDNAAPLLNFPTGNIVGISELDIQSMELVPGAASALYGPNAFNGILFMNSKNPFDYQGLSAQVKVGATNSVAQASEAAPYYNMSIRYAKAFNDKFAFKVNFSYLQAQDWFANDYTTGRQLISSTPANPGDPNFDGLNLYGDETQVFVPMSVLATPLSNALAPLFAPAFGGNVALAQQTLQNLIPTLPTLDVRRTGLRELDILDNNDAKSIKLDAALHYRISDNLELSYLFKRGSGSTVYQGSERYALRDFSQTFHKLELKGGNFFVRAYTSITDAGNSFNLSALGGFANERFSPTSTQWLPTYAGTYAGALLPILLQGGAITSTDIAAANAAGRTAADAVIPAAGSAEFQAVIDATRSDFFQRNPPGAGFFDNSKLYHAEFNYNASDLIDNVLELQIGGNFRRFDLFSDGTIFNEDPEGDGTNERITIDEYGFYLQAGKTLLNDRLKLAASLRYDKNQNFDGQFNPRISAVYSAGKNKEHNIRASFQTGFRNPDTQSQFIYFPTSSGTLLGGAAANAERYGVYNGGAYTYSSYQAFLGSILAGTPNPTLLQEANIPYIQPEQLQAIEVGYKGLIGNKFLLDVNYYYNIYNDFSVLQTVVAKDAVTHQGVTYPGVNQMLAGQATSASLWRLYSNSSVQLTSQGLGVGLAYQLPKGYVLQGNYNWASFEVPADAPADFEPGFNTPANRFSATVSNRDAFKGVGFSLSYRWQDEIQWESSFGAGTVDPYGSFDVQLNYTLKKIRTMFKLGATNLFGDDYRTIVGGPFIGQMYYLSLTFDEFLK